MKMRMLGLLLGSACLAACGGGGSSGGGSSPVVTPSPSPTPTPTPSGPSYTAYADLTGSQQFKMACQTLDQGSGVFQLGPPMAFYTDPGVTLSYDASQDSYTLSNYGVEESFGSADIDSSVTNPEIEIAYAKDDGTGFTSRLLIAAPQPGGQAVDYSRALYAFVKNVNTGYVETYSCNFGVPTLLTDTPSQSPITFTDFTTRGTLYRIYPDATFAVYNLSGSSQTMSANATTGEITISLALSGELVSVNGTSTVPASIDLGTYGATINIDGETQGFGGIFNYEDPTLFAPFEGWFYGPQGTEAAFAAGIQDTDENNVRTIGTFSFFAAR